MPKTKTSWKPGQSGNPKGGPKKGYSITDWFKEFLSANPEDRERIAKAIVDKAVKGDTAAIKLIWNYMDGLPKQSTDITSKDEKIENLVIIKTK